MAKASLRFVVLLVTLAVTVTVSAQTFVRVKRVVDDDTLQLESGERVRLIGVNTPETKHTNKQVEYFGKEASAFTKRMVEGKLVRLEYESLAGGSDRKDRFKRTLVYVFVEDGSHLNEEIIKQATAFPLVLKYKVWTRQNESAEESSLGDDFVRR